MKRLKTFLIYALMIIGFWIFSDFLISVGINSTYKPMDVANDSGGQLQVYQAESTLVNGRIKGVINNSPENNIANKFAKMQLFSANGTELGTRYFQIGDLGPNDSQPIEMFFKIDNVKSVKMDIVDTKGPEEEISLLPRDLTTGEVLWAVLIVLMIW